MYILFENYKFTAQTKQTLPWIPQRGTHEIATFYLP